jgi:hypothetical protein
MPGNYPAPFLKVFSAVKYLLNELNGKLYKIMAIKTHLYSGLSRYTNGINEVMVSGANIGDCLNDLTAQFP